MYSQTLNTSAPPVAPHVEHREVRHGATVVDPYYWLREKSNPKVAQYLEAENAYTEAQTRHLPVVEVIGDAGDMVLMHPHTYHGSSDNCSDRFRVASNICVGLHEPMNLDRADPDDYSPVERAIVESPSTSSQTESG